MSLFFVVLRVGVVLCVSCFDMSTGLMEEERGFSMKFLSYSYQYWFVLIVVLGGHLSSEILNLTAKYILSCFSSCDA